MPYTNSYLTADEIYRSFSEHRKTNNREICTDCGQRPVFGFLFHHWYCRKHYLMFKNCSGCGGKFKPDKPDDRFCRNCLRSINRSVSNFSELLKNRGIRKTKFTILNRDHFTCYYCGRTSFSDGMKLHVDHIVPLKKGGKDIAGNLVTSCAECNIQKFTTGILEIRAMLLDISKRNKEAGISNDLEIPMRVIVNTRSDNNLDMPK